MASVSEEYQVFARKYRPKTFDDVLGQDHVIQTLKNAIEQERLAQARRLLDFLAVEQHDIVILGDFNSKPKSSIIELFRADWEIPDKGEDHFTFRSDRPEVEIDYALIHKDSTWSVSEIDVIEEPLVSDHRPLVFEIVEDQ